MAVQIESVPVSKPEGANVIIGQAHFVKTAEDLYEAMVNSVPNVKFGLAFCEASGDRLVRGEGTDDALRELAVENAKRIGAGHSFIIVMSGAFPINVLNAVKSVPEVCGIFCATANDVEVLVAVTAQGRGVVGVVDGQAPLGIESEGDVQARRSLLRRFGYKR